ncbi:MAG: hypothetical protein MSS94_08390, partial [Clostridiales bacterium]|nr:hypothetical protein [Clostridiales bacterium]
RHRPGVIALAGIPLGNQRHIIHLEYLLVFVLSYHLFEKNATLLPHRPSAGKTSALFSSYFP